MAPEEKVWEILLSADKKDYERICAEYGIKDFRGMLKKLTEMKKEREEEIAEVSVSLLIMFSIRPGLLSMTSICDSFLHLNFFFSLSPKLAL